LDCIPGFFAVLREVFALLVLFEYGRRLNVIIWYYRKYLLLTSMCGKS